MAHLRTAFRYGAVIVVSLVALSAASAFLTETQLERRPPRAVIFDPLYDTQTGVNFTDTLEACLGGGGFKVDVYRGIETSVERLTEIPGGCRLLVFRAHSGVFEDEVWLFTGEEFDGSRYVMMQLADEVHLSRSPNDPRMVFAVGSTFVERHMGKFHRCLVVLMGCEGLCDEALAEAFREAGASAVVGWAGPVSLSSSDEVVLSLILRMLEGEPLGSAVEACRGELGDSLLIYPVEGAASFSLR
ncbi:hypothetical protein JXL21_12085 [Candidatus Bathyarchaeota archaeon]|nr:hypothetical protein [Candidatus Bathyarchaeota archaeon]